MKPTLVALLMLTALAAGCFDGEKVVESTISFHFGGRHADITATVESDLMKRPTKDAYEAAGIEHSDFYNLHDQLDDWSRQSGKSYDAEGFNSAFGSGFFLTTVDGVTAGGSDAYWALEVNDIAVSKGMSDIRLHAGDHVDWLYTVIESDGGASELGLQVDAIDPSPEATARLSGSVGVPAKVSVEARRDGERIFAQSIDADGLWTLDVQGIPFGRSLVVVTADDGATTQRADLMLVRLAPATVAAEFTSAVPQRPAVNDTIWVDVDAFLSAPQYVGQPIEHPPFANVHDVMETWNATRPIAFSFHPSFGAGVESIDGHGALSDWCYDVNGDSAPLGITGMEFHPGDVIEWHGCALV